MENLRTQLYNTVQELQLLDETLQLTTIWDISHQSLQWTPGRTVEAEQLDEEKELPQTARIWTSLPTLQSWEQAYLLKTALVSTGTLLLTHFQLLNSKDTLTAFFQILEASYPEPLTQANRTELASKDSFIRHLPSNLKIATKYLRQMIFTATTEENFWSRKLADSEDTPSPLDHVGRVLSSCVTMLLEAVQCYHQLLGFLTVRRQATTKQALATLLIDVHIAAHVYNRTSLDNNISQTTEAQINYLQLARQWGNIITTLYTFHRRPIAEPAVQEATITRCVQEALRDKQAHTDEVSQLAVATELQADPDTRLNQITYCQMVRQTAKEDLIRRHVAREDNLNFNRQGDRRIAPKPPDSVTVLTVPAAKEARVDSGLVHCEFRPDSVEFYNTGQDHRIAFSSTSRIETAYIRFQNQPPELAKVARVKMGASYLAIDLTPFTIHYVKKMMSKSTTKVIDSYKVCFIEEFTNGSIQPLIFVIPYVTHFLVDPSLSASIESEDPSKHVWLVSSIIEQKFLELRRRVYTRRSKARGDSKQLELVREENFRFYQVTVPQDTTSCQAAALKADNESISEGALTSVERCRSAAASEPSILAMLILYNRITTAGIVALAAISKETQNRSLQTTQAPRDFLPRVRWKTFLATGDYLLSNVGTRKTKRFISRQQFYTTTLSTLAELSVEDAKAVEEEDDEQLIPVEVVDPPDKPEPNIETVISDRDEEREPLPVTLLERQIQMEDMDSPSDDESALESIVEEDLQEEALDEEASGDD